MRSSPSSSQNYRNAAILNALVAAVWTLVMILPFEPFTFILPIIAGGGPGTWLILGYILYLTVGFSGFIGLSFIALTIENYEGRIADKRLVSVGLVLMDGGVTSATILLGIAGFAGGYASTIQHLPTQVIRTILLPYVNVISILALIATIGVIVSILAILMAKAPK